MDERNTRPPSFQFYPRDFMSDPAVLQMGLAARGAYINLLCVSWMSDQPGILPSDDEALARLSLAGSEWPAVADAVRRAFKVKGTNLVQSRMVSEREAQRQRHERASAGGRATAEKRWGSVAQQPLENSNAVTPASASASASAEIQSQNTIPPPRGGVRVRDSEREHPDFPRFYAAFPRRDGRRAAAKAFASALRRSLTFGLSEPYTGDDLVWAAQEFAARCASEAREARFVPLPATWLNQDRYREFFTEHPATPGANGVTHA